MKIELGQPTDYKYDLPKIRYAFCKKYFKNHQFNKYLLDYGCGNGANTISFNKDFQHLIGIDVEYKRISEANYYKRKNHLKNIEYILYDGKKIPDNLPKFDCVISFEVLEHTEDDITSLHQIYQSLKKKGLFFLSVPNKWYLMETHGFRLPFNQTIPYHRIPFLNFLPHWFYKRFGNARIYKKSEIIEKLEKSGFVVKHIEYIRPPFDKLRSKKIKKKLRSIYSLLPSFMGVSIIIHCEKN
jgi:2-polyprenyl-3-methyl-5-hydroxy-6-metoxy-1,4-benzoquinol methylase